MITKERIFINKPHQIIIILNLTTKEKKDER